MRFLLVSLLLFSYPLIADVNQKNDFQFWDNQRFVVELSRDVAVYWETEFRWGNDASHLFYCYLQPGVLITLCPGFVIGPAYRQIVEDRSSSDRSRLLIYSPMLDVIFSHTFRKWYLENRSRWEFLIPEYSDIPSALLYRNCVLIVSPWKIGKMELTPYMSEEPFFIEYVGFSENRLIFGGRFKPAPRFEANWYYMLRCLKDVTWRSINVMGFAFTISY